MEAPQSLSTAIAHGASFADKLPLAGVVDGTNKVFVLAKAPNPASSVHIYKVTS